jgi:hypothetical protein
MEGAALRFLSERALDYGEIRVAELDHSLHKRKRRLHARTHARTHARSTYAFTHARAHTNRHIRRGIVAGYSEVKLCLGYSGAHAPVCR